MFHLHVTPYASIIKVRYVVLSFVNLPSLIFQVDTVHIIISTYRFISARCCLKHGHTQQRTLWRSIAQTMRPVLPKIRSNVIESCTARTVGPFCCGYTTDSADDLQLCRNHQRHPSLPSSSLNSRISSSLSSLDPLSSRSSWLCLKTRQNLVEAG